MADDKDKIKEKGNIEKTSDESSKKDSAVKNTDTKQEPRGGGTMNRRDVGDRAGSRPRRNRRIVRRQDRREYDQKIISIRRVTRVVAGGRRFSFSVAVVIGDRKGKVGVGVGKAGDTALAIEKAIRQAKKNMVKLNLTEKMSIGHDVSSKYCASWKSVV